MEWRAAESGYRRYSSAVGLYGRRAFIDLAQSVRGRGRRPLLIKHRGSIYELVSKFDCRYARERYIRVFISKCTFDSSFNSSPTKDLAYECGVLRHSGGCAFHLHLIRPMMDRNGLIGKFAMALGHPDVCVFVIPVAGYCSFRRTWLLHADTFETASTLWQFWRMAFAWLIVFGPIYWMKR